MKVKTFVVNNKRYTAKVFDYDMQCMLEENGITLGNLSKKPQNAMRVFLAYCGEIDLSEAGVELTQHIINGGTLDGLAEAFKFALDESDFFRALKARAEEIAAENQEETPEAMSEEKKESKESKK